MGSSMKAVLISLEIPGGILALAVVALELALTAKELADGWHGQLCHHVLAPDVGTNDPVLCRLFLSHAVPTSFLNSDPWHAIPDDPRGVPSSPPGA